MSCLYLLKINECEPRPFNHPMSEAAGRPPWPMYPRLGCPASWENRNFSSDQQEILFLLMLELKIPQGEREGHSSIPAGHEMYPTPSH